MNSEEFRPKSNTLVQAATEMHTDHEIQMAREACYRSASNAIELHRMLKHVSEQEGLDAWASEKISLANDYLRTVKEWLEYELMTKLENRVAENQFEVFESTYNEIANQGVAEAEKNPHTSALGKALYRDLSKEKKASPQQVQRNKERWAKRQAEREQGVAEGSLNEFSSDSEDDGYYKEYLRGYKDGKGYPEVVKSSKKREIWMTVTPKNPPLTEPYMRGWYDGKYGPAPGKDLIDLNKLSEQGVTEGKEAYPEVLYHGSTQKIKGPLNPRQAHDIGGAEGSNKLAIYATDDPNFAIAIGLAERGSDTGTFGWEKEPRLILFGGKIRHGENVYVHVLPTKDDQGRPLFTRGAAYAEWYSLPGVEEITPLKVIAKPVDQYLHLLRKPTPEEQKKFQANKDKDKAKQGVAEGGIVKSIKRRMQGWGDGVKPDDIKRRAGEYSDDELKDIAGSHDELRRVRATDLMPTEVPKHSPAGLQKRLIDREMRKRGLGEQGVAEGQVDIFEKKKPKPTSPDKWARAKAKAKSKFDVYPSAYANAYASKEYKKMGGGWRMGESTEEEQLDELKCWPGYSRVQGVPAGKPGSCKKKTK